MSNASWEPQHFSILTSDIEGFGSTTRSDPIRAGLRRSLHSIMDDAISKVDQKSSVAGSGDTGDGMWHLFSPTLSKIQILEQIVPNIEVQLRHYNAAASTAARLRLRIGLHHGELIPDDNGYSGEPLNHAFRIVDNDVVRQALKASPQNIVLVVSNDFYDKIVRPGYGSVDPTTFSPLEVENKETKTIVWLHPRGVADSSGSLKTISQHQAKLASDRATQQVLTISDLPPTTLYVAVSDIHNAMLYERSYPEAPIRQHLEAALLLAEKVVVHCADAYRSKVVADTVNDLGPCVDVGDFLFLLGENAQEPRSHFRGYIDYKVDQYGKSRFGRRDVQSLTDVDPTPLTGPRNCSTGARSP